MAVPPLTVPAFIGPGGGSGLLSDLESGAGSGGVAAVGAGLVGLGAAAVVIPLLAVPLSGPLAVGGVVGGSILAVGAFLEALNQLREWGIVNWRPLPVTTAPGEGDEFVISPTNVGRTLRLTLTQRTSSRVRCADGIEVSDGVIGPEEIEVGFATFHKVRVGKLTTSNENKCPPGTNVPGVSAMVLQCIRLNGSVALSVTATNGGTTYVSGLGSERSINTRIHSNIRVTGGPQPVLIEATSPGSFAPGVRPQLFPSVVPDALPLPAPATPLETPVLPPPPDRRPLAPPVTIPRPGQQPARVPVPGPRPGPAPSPGPGPVPAQPGALPVPAVGPLPAPRPLPVPTTPGAVVVVDGQPIGGPGQAPAPNLVAIAQELGRLERKNEILMSRPENGGLGEVAENAILAVLRRLLEQLVNELLNDVPAGSFTLTHACPPTGGTDPLPPVEVPYSAGSNATAGILARLDGLAGLIQAHKDMGQPTCRTPRVGQEVTVQFESDG